MLGFRVADSWIGWIQGSSLALVVADREADTWVSLRHGRLPSRPHNSVWVAPAMAYWQEHPVLRHIASRAGPNGRPATAAGLKLCTQCIDPRLATPGASVVQQKSFR